MIKNDTTPNLKPVEAKTNQPKDKVAIENKVTSKTKEQTHISEQGKKLADKSSILKVKEIQKKKFGDLKEPGVIYISGFDWFGASSVKGNYDGIRDMSEATDYGMHFSWDQKEEIIQEIKKREPDQPIAIVGHSFGGDTAMEIASELNSLEHGFRKINLLITLDSVGFNNDIVPSNVTKNINFLAHDNFWINDTANIAEDYRKTEVSNYLREEAHAELDDALEIQQRIIDEVHKIV